MSALSSVTVYATKGHTLATCVEEAQAAVRLFNKPVRLIFNDVPIMVDVDTTLESALAWYEKVCGKGKEVVAS
jgi:hypothetical protein